MLDPENQSMKDIALKSKLCTAAQMSEVLEEHERTGRPVRDILIDFQLVTEEQLLGAIAQQLGLDFVDLSNVEIEQSVIDMLDGGTVRSAGVVPVDFDGYTLTVAARNPLDMQVPDELHFVTGKPVTVVVALESEIDALIEKYYPLDMASVHD